MNRILFQSLIDVDKWNEAQWTATAFLHDPRGLERPCLGLVFEDTNAGRDIFIDLRRRLGQVDKFEELYVSVIEGEIPGEEPGYTVHISSDPSRTEAKLRTQGQQRSFDQAIVVSRFHRMTPAPGSPHLRNFKSQVLAHRRYALLPVSSDIQPQFDCGIEKKGIHFRQASDITKSDRDAVVFPERYFDGQSVKTPSPRT
jgi:hypothetical protein